MLSLSVGKILLVVLVAIVAWRGLRIYQQVQARLAERQAARPRAAASVRTTDLVECPRCGTFVPNGTVCRSREECRFRSAG